MKYFLQILFFSLLSLAIINACNNNKTEKTVTDTDTAKINTDTAYSADTSTRVVTASDPMKGMLDRMKAVNMTGDFDVDFANMMIEHHQGGIDMSQQYLQQSKNDSIASMARAIISDQNKEIEELKDFIKTYKGSGMKHGEGELTKSMQEMEQHMPMMSHTGDADKDFAINMSSHHEQGISMAKKELKNGMSGDLKKKAQQMIDKQSKEISAFKKWVSAHQ